MQFGVGILGSRFDPDEVIERMLTSIAPSNISPRRAAHSAAKIAAESLLAEPSGFPDLTDSGIVRSLALCARPVRPSEAAAVRDAFKSEFGWVPVKQEGTADV